MPLLTFTLLRFAAAAPYAIMPHPRFDDAVTPLHCFRRHYLMLLRAALRHASHYFADAFRYANIAGY